MHHGWHSLFKGHTHRVTDGVKSTSDHISRLVFLFWCSKIGSIRITFECKVILEISSEKIRTICAAAVHHARELVNILKNAFRKVVEVFKSSSSSNNPTDPVIDAIELHSIIIKLRFFTPESFLKFLDYYESGLLKEALIKEFAKINILDESLPAEFRECLTGKDAQFDVNDELTVKIRNEKEVENYRDKLNRK